MQSSLVVLEPAKSFSLISLADAKIGLNLSNSTNKTLDRQIEMFTEWASDEVAVMCNRVFAREKVREIFSGDSFDNRVFLSRWPVTQIDSITEDETGVTVDVDFTLDPVSGTLFRIDGAWSSPVQITYTGGYKLPDESPPALRQATLLMTREAYNAAIRGDSTIRMVAHKESRVMYFDPNAKGAAAAGGAGSASRRATADLLKRYMRFWV